MIDIHTHTTYSDGSFSVKEIMEEAECVGLSLLSITDHNTIQAYQELKNLYLRRGDRDHPSFVVYVEAVNQIYQTIR